MEKPASLFTVIYILLKSHARLFYYELQHETDLAWRRLQIIGVGVMLLLACSVFIEVAAFAALRVLGLNLFVALGLMAVVNGLTGAMLILRVGRRLTNDGNVFEMSRAEYQRTIQWIENRFVNNNTASAIKSN